MKSFIWVGIAIGGTLGGWLGSMIDNGNFLGGWGIIGSTIGSIIGVWAGYKIAQFYL